MRPAETISHTVALSILLPVHFLALTARACYLVLLPVPAFVTYFFLYAAYFLLRGIYSFFFSVLRAGFTRVSASHGAYQNNLSIQYPNFRKKTVRRRK